MAHLKSNTRITAADHFQDTRHAEFVLGQDGPQYSPGDILTIFPSQSREDVGQLLDRLGYDPCSRIQIDLAEPEGDHAGRTTMEVSTSAELAGNSDSET